MNRPLLALVGCLFASSWLLPRHVAADTFEWTSAVSDDFLDPSRWTLVSGTGPPPPGVGDTAIFNENGLYSIRFTSGGITRSDVLNVTAGAVTFYRSSATEPARYAVETGDADATITAATLTVGPPVNPPLPLEFVVGDELTVNSGGALNITFGSTVTTNDLRLEASDGFVADAGSRLEVTGNAEVDDGSSLVVSGNAEASFASDLLIGDSSSVRLENGGDVSVDGTIRLGSSSLALGTAIANIQSSTSNLNAESLEMGSTDGQRGVLNLSAGSVTVDRLTLRETAVINFTGGELSVGGVFGDGIGINWSSGSFSLGSDLLVGPEGLFPGGILLDRFDKSLSVAGTIHVESQRKLELGPGTLSGGTLLLSPAATLLSTAASPPAQIAVVAQTGSRIELTNADLEIGDAARVDGFYSNGRTVIGSNRLTIRDANDAVFDSAAIVELGKEGAAGTLAADGGIALDLGGNLTGFGTVDTPDDPATPLINNGHITGNSVAERITLTGYVQGTGTCDFCTITGTDAPGFSPAAVNRGTVSYEGLLEIEIAGPMPGSGFDQLNHILGSGLADLGGELDVRLLGGFTPSAGDSFEIITATGGVTGTFATQTLPDLAGLVWNIDYGTHQVVLEVLAGFTADFDKDGDVDGADFLIWQANFNTAGPHTSNTGDTDGDGDVDGEDFLVWQTQFGSRLGDGGTVPAVPEPTTAVWCLVLPVMLVRRGCR